MSDRLSEYFAREAGDYLSDLDRLLAGSGVIDSRELLRLARAVRGSAQMAGAETIAGVAERLEDAARSVASNTIIWTDEVRKLALQTVRDLQVLVRAIHRWGPDEERRVREAILRWSDMEGADGPRLVEPDVVPIEALFYDDEEPSAEHDGDVVPIETLQLAGADALQEALALRPALLGAMARGGSDAESGAIVEELFDLIRLGISTANPRG